jgi:GNAT superfamily N-acetyltransferase
MDNVATDEPASVEVLAEYAIAGRGWVAVDVADRPVGYVVVDLVDGDVHIEQISVRPDHQAAGVGRALIDRVRAWTSGTGRSRMTLTTFADVPWNCPLFEHLGFIVIPDDEIGAALRAVRDAEAGRGLDPAMRVCMRFDLRN